jgi:hypothetical protein
MRPMILSLVLGTVLFSACKSGKVCDLRREGGEFCEIHHLYMHSEKFPNPHRTIPPSREYLEARTRYFVHAKPTLFMVPDECKTCVVYICDECVKTDQEWRAAHPALAP